MKVMLNTNILISAFVFKSKIIYKLINKLSIEHQILISTYCLEELYEVVKKKFKVNIGEIDKFLESFPFEKVQTPKNVEEKLFEIRDEDDYLILYTAIIEDVDIFITGDKDFENVNIKKPKIMSIKEFLINY